MKKTNIIISIIVIVVIIIVAFFAFGHKSSAPSTTTSTATNTTTGNTLPVPANSNTAPTVSAPATQTTTVSKTSSKYENAELGFTLDYPTAWNVTNNPTGPVFDLPVKFPETTTIATLQASVYPGAGKCTFPPVASSTIKDNSTLKAGDMTFNVISVANTVNSLNYFNRMYTLQQGTAKSPFCYYFSFVSITRASNVASVSAANQTRIQAADAAFTAMVKTFALVAPAAADSETAHPAGK